MKWNLFREKKYFDGTNYFIYLCFKEPIVILSSQILIRVILYGPADYELELEINSS